MDVALPGRRVFLGGALVLLCAPPGCGEGESGEGKSTFLGEWEIPPDTTLSEERYALLAALMDAILPGDAESPGATIARAAFYVDSLLGAFRSDPPKIFAGGPNSGRHGGTDQFSNFQRLTRVEELRWRTYLEGSNGIPEREWNGPVQGLRRTYEQGLDALNTLSKDTLGQAYWEASFDDRKHLLGDVEPQFKQMVYEHAVEGTYGDPVYGGNFEQAGWRAIDYEGDRQPVGFSAREMAHPEEG